MKVQIHHCKFNLLIPSKWLLKGANKTRNSAVFGKRIVNVNKIGREKNTIIEIFSNIIRFLKVALIVVYAYRQAYWILFEYK